MKIDFDSRNVFCYTLSVFHAGINLYEEALVYHPKCAEALYNLAVVYGEDQNISKAMFMYEMCLLVKPDCAEAHNNLGVFYRTMGNLERAYQCYMNALQINPKFHQALSNVAVIFTSQVSSHWPYSSFPFSFDLFFPSDPSLSVKIKSILTTWINTPQLMFGNVIQISLVVLETNSKSVHENVVYLFAKGQM